MWIPIAATWAVPCIAMLVIDMAGPRNAITTSRLPTTQSAIFAALHFLGSPISPMIPAVLDVPFISPVLAQ